MSDLNPKVRADVEAALERAGCSLPECTTFHLQWYPGLVAQHLGMAHQSLTAQHRSFWGDVIRALVNLFYVPAEEARVAPER